MNITEAAALLHARTHPGGPGFDWERFNDHPLDEETLARICAQHENDTEEWGGIGISAGLDWD